MSRATPPGDEPFAEMAAEGSLAPNTTILMAATASISEACSSAGAAAAGSAALERAPFILRQTAPHAKILPRLNGPFQACLNDLATTADRLGLFDLKESRAGVPNREEQLGVFIQAGSAIAPSHH